MQSFSYPEYKLKFHNCDKDFLQTKKHIFNSIPFHSAHLLIPTANSLSGSCKKILKSDEDTYFLIKEISVSNLIEPVFIKNFLKKGLLHAASQNYEKSGNYVALTLSGKLVIKLETNIMGYLSLLKEKSTSQNRKEMETHQMCIVDINSMDFEFDKTYYKTVASELKKIDHIKFDLLLRWKPEGNICCESITQYFESLDLECTPCEMSFKQETTTYIPVPKINFKVMNPLLNEDILEWIGVILCKIKYADESEQFVSRFYQPECSESRKVHISSCEGFFASDKICNSIEEARKLFALDSNISFIAMLFTGYQHCYVDSKENGHFISADKFICILISPESDVWMITLNV